MKILGIIIKVAVLAVIVMFAAFNMEQVSIKYCVTRNPLLLPLSITLIISFLLGMITAYLIFIGDRIKLKKELNKMKKDLKKTNDELLRLRNLPLMEEDLSQNRINE